MLDLYTEAFRLPHLPFSLLLILIVAYWLLVLVGVGIGDDGDLDLGDSSGPGNGGWLHRVGDFLAIGTVPFILVLSVMSLCMWGLSIGLNAYFNATRSSLVALLLLLPNLLISGFITRIVLIPVRSFFDAAKKIEEANHSVVGREGDVISSQVDSTFGQVSIATNGAPLLLNARTAEGQAPIPKGSRVIVLKSAEDHSIHLVQLSPVNISV
jgi:hypothetical protein